MSKRILVIGSLNMDLVSQTERGVEAGETVIGRDYSLICGGKGANTAVALARLGASVSFCGCVGKDAYGEVLLASLKGEKIDCKYTRILQDCLTGFAIVIVQADGQNRIIVHSGANHALSQSDIDGVLANSWDAVMMQREIRPEIVAYVAEKAATKNIPVILDAGPATDFEPQPLFGNLTIISPNELECRLITGIMPTDETSARRAAFELYKLTGARLSVIKMGDKGAYAFDHVDKSDCFFPAFPIKPVDTTAAGDAFTAAFTLAWLNKSSLYKALAWACAAGALCALRNGAQPSLPTGDEVTNFYLEGRKK